MDQELVFLSVQQLFYLRLVEIWHVNYIYHWRIDFEFLKTNFYPTIKWVFYYFEILLNNYFQFYPDISSAKLNNLNFLPTWSFVSLPRHTTSSTATTLKSTSYGRPLGHFPKGHFLYKCTSYEQPPALKGHFSCVTKVAAKAGSTVSGNYPYLFNLSPHICKSWCLTTHFIPITVILSANKPNLVLLEPYLTVSVRVPSLYVTIWHLWTSDSDVTV